MIEPLDPSGASELVARLLGAALLAARWLVETSAGVTLFGGDDISLPDTVRDAVLVRATQLSAAARGVLEVASLAGLRFELAVVAGFAGKAAIDEPVTTGILVEVEPGVAAFRHTLTREVFYRDVPWGRRRELHRGWLSTGAAWRPRRSCRPIRSRRSFESAWPSGLVQSPAGLGRRERSRLA